MQFGSIISHLVRPLLRRALIALALGIFALIAVYHFTSAGNIALAGEYGDLNARLIIGGIYAALALILLIVLWVMRSKPARSAGAPTLQKPREMQLVMLMEAVMLGYALARKSERAR
jgi:type VI protein secretion system component VasK